MKDWRNFFKGKKVTIMGLGLLGRALGDAQFLAENGADLIVTDLKGDAELRASLAILAVHPNVKYRLGGHELTDFRGRDFILQAAGVRPNSPYLAEAKRNGIPIKMSASWFLELAEIPLVGVTGTRGKSTTTHLLHEIMKAAGMDVLLGGNVRGVSTLALLPLVKSGSIALMELDSWQARGFGENGISPHIAVFTTFMADHLDYYKGDMDAYLDDKAQIFLHQKPEDTLIVGSVTAQLLKEKYGRKIISHVIVADPARFPDGWKLSLPGAHNLLNSLCAIEAARALGIDDRVIRATVERFKGIAGRLELVREAGGVKIYNDTTATTPEATIAGLRALDGGAKRTILIVGGADKGLDVSNLISELPFYTKKVVLLAGTGTEKLFPLFGNSMRCHATLRAALDEALASATSGDTILFSPAFASFGMFKNEFDRGDQFTALVTQLAP